MNLFYSKNTTIDHNEIVINEGGRIVKDGQNVKIFNEDE